MHIFSSCLYFIVILEKQVIQVFFFFNTDCLYCDYDQYDCIFLTYSMLQWQHQHGNFTPQINTTLATWLY